MHSGLLCSVWHGIKPNFKYSTLYPCRLIFPVADHFKLMINLWTDKHWRTFPVLTKFRVNRQCVVACNMRWRCDLLKPQNYEFLCYTHTLPNLRYWLVVCNKNYLNQYCNQYSFAQKNIYLLQTPSLLHRPWQTAKIVCRPQVANHWCRWNIIGTQQSSCT